MPNPSSELQEIASKRIFSEVYEEVRQFSVILEEPHITVDVLLRRYYGETDSHYAVFYSREFEDGHKDNYDYGQVLTGSEDEEAAIRTAISFIRDAHKLR